jgi:hypothetical protein
VTNLSILQRNMLATMSEEAGALYLRGCERDEWKACNMAWDLDRIMATGKAMITAAEKAYGDQKGAAHGVGASVWEYAKERLYRMHFPDGRAA